MPNLDARILLLALATCIGGCSDDGDDEPEPIGPELMSFVGGVGSCAEGHLHRDDREIQNLCFDEDGNFSHENRGTLSPEAAQKLDDELAAADLTATERVGFMSPCGTTSVTVTLWVQGWRLRFGYTCPREGILALYEHVVAFLIELNQCGTPAPQLLESIEPGCGGS